VLSPAPIASGRRGRSGLTIPAASRSRHDNVTTPLRPFRAWFLGERGVHLVEGRPPGLISNRRKWRNLFAGSRRVGFVYSAGWAGGAAAIIGMLNGRDICMVFTTLRETNDGNGGPLAR
jgi:hypothetical protein